MELRNIFTFLRAAELESFSKVANELSYAHSTVTMQIQQLENEFGFPLFDRIGKRVFLSEKGRAFLPYANEIVQTLTRAQMLTCRPTEVTGHLRLGIVESLFHAIFSKLIHRYHQQLPHVTIETKTASTADLLQLLHRNELDIVFVLDKKIYDKDFVKAFSCDDRIVFVGHPSNPYVKSGASLKDLVKMPLILTEKNGSYRQGLDEALAKQDLCAEPFLQVDNTEIILRLIKAGLGISFLPEFAALGSINRQELAVINITDFSLNFESQIFYHKNKWVAPQMQGFIDVISEYYASQT